ncbi:protein-L-isoaspartate(D-aspartate) O-methyltransferase [Desulfogranum mediterraneum]|uniref:protein-L-isoaspartate(D-aspartate) O-methyltransferase n=1 Tax=Desulfogranum mediterraneum TaxID=160661 RepID=UPI00040FCC0A|nr:protein-L-isoaspartate(D-aspartate) O-methyltransferase [Desulfogranum mediterraneum]
MVQRRTLVGVFVLILLLIPLGRLAAAEPYEELRRSLLREIIENVRTTSRYLKKSSLDEEVMVAMSKVPRHLFVPEAYRRQAYENRPLPIGQGQTISQPYIVAIMTDLLNLDPSDLVLEVGTGSGYQAAVLAELVNRVYSMEIIEKLQSSAAERLKQLGYTNVETRLGDGYYGWEEHAPFDAIIVTAAAGQIPPPLIRQLKPGGRMVIPVGSTFMTQYLLLVEKRRDGSLSTRQVLPVRFVPLTGIH